MKEKNIIIFMPTIDSGGGVEKNFFIITNYLSKKFNKVTVITLAKSTETKLNKNVNIISPKLILVNYLGRRAKFLVALIYLLKAIISNKNPTVFCFQGIIYCTLLCKIIGTKIIIRSNSSPSGWSDNIIKKILYKIIYSFADKIVVNSLNFKKELKKKFNLKSECIYNPLNKIEIIEKSKSRINLNYFNKNNLNLIMVARFEKQKDHECLIKSINLIKDKSNIKLLLVGSGNLQKKMFMLIKKLNLSKNIKIINNKKNPYPYIKMSDAFILSSKYEGCPNVLLEAITLKKFIISSDCPTGPSEILDSGKGGILFKVGNYKMLADKIIFYKKNKKFLNKKKAHAYKMLKRFDYKDRLEDYYRIINS
jgi:glycosyltransferase involved in cell wall biosynthesis